MSEEMLYNVKRCAAILNYKDNYDIAEINVNWSVIDHQQDT